MKSFNGIILYLIWIVGLVLVITENNQVHASGVEKSLSTTGHSLFHLPFELDEFDDHVNEVAIERVQEVHRLKKKAETEQTQEFVIPSLPVIPTLHTSVLYRARTMDVRHNQLNYVLSQTTGLKENQVIKVIKTKPLTYRLQNALILGDALPSVLSVVEKVSGLNAIQSTVEKEKIKALHSNASPLKASHGQVFTLHHVTVNQEALHAVLALAQHANGLCAHKKKKSPKSAKSQFLIGKLLVLPSKLDSLLGVIGSETKKTLTSDGYYVLEDAHVSGKDLSQALTLSDESKGVTAVIKSKQHDKISQSFKIRSLRVLDSDVDHILDLIEGVDYVDEYFGHALYQTELELNQAETEAVKTLTMQLNDAVQAVKPSFLPEEDKANQRGQHSTGFITPTQSYYGAETLQTTGILDDIELSEIHQTEDHPTIQSKPEKPSPSLLEKVFHFFD